MLDILVNWSLGCWSITESMILMKTQHADFSSAGAREGEL